MKLNFLTIALLLPFLIFAQNIKIKKQDVFVNDSPYCKMDGKTGLSALTDIETEFTISSVQGKSLVYIKSLDEKYLKVIFLADGTKIKMKRSPTLQAGDRKYFIKKMFDTKLIQGDTINEDAKKLFILKNDETEEYEAQQNQPASSSPGDYTVVNRNTLADIFLIGGKIMQDNETIGSYQTSDENTNGSLKVIVTLLLPNNTVVAKLTADNFNASNNSLLTLKDNRLTSLSNLSGDMNVNGDSNIEKTIKWLIERGYM